MLLGPEATFSEVAMSQRLCGKKAHAEVGAHNDKAETGLSREEMWDISQTHRNRDMAPEPQASLLEMGARLPTSLGPSLLTISHAIAILDGRL